MENLLVYDMVRSAMQIGLRTLGVVVDGLYFQYDESKREYSFQLPRRAKQELELQNLVRGGAWYPHTDGPLFAIKGIREHKEGEKEGQPRLELIPSCRQSQRTRVVKLQPPNPKMRVVYEEELELHSLLESRFGVREDCCRHILSFLLEPRQEEALVDTFDAWGRRVQGPARVQPEAGYNVLESVADMVVTRGGGMILGPAGVGKTKLLWLINERLPTWRRGSCPMASPSSACSTATRTATSATPSSFWTRLA
jgi:hypothetical protein